MDSEAFSLFDDRGQRLYLTADERLAFKAAVKVRPKGKAKRIPLF